MTVLLDGKALAAEMRSAIAIDVTRFAAAHGRPPALAVVLVGDDPASQVYVNSKGRLCREVGMRSIEHRLPAGCAPAALLELVARLNADPGVDGILVQLPLPAHHDPATVLAGIDPAKDVDGFHPVNVGRLATGLDGLVPCTPLGCIALAKRAQADLSGLHAVVVGRSNIVGKPVTQLLLRENCTVTIAHSRSRDLAALCRQADLLVAAIGRPRALGAAHVREGAIVVDVGINRIAAAEGRTRLVGDVDFEAVAGRCRAITPVPGGVGPTTIAFLLANTLKAAQRRLG